MKAVIVEIDDDGVGMHSLLPLESGGKFERLLAGAKIRETLTVSNKTQSSLLCNLNFSSHRIFCLLLIDLYVVMAKFVKVISFLHHKRLHIFRS